MEIQKFEYLEKDKSFLDEIKFFIVFEGLLVGEKLLKNSRHIFHDPPMVHGGCLAGRN